MGKHTSTLDVEKVNVMGSGVNDTPECHGVCHLSVEPDVLVGGEQKGQFGSNNSDDIAQHGYKNHASVEREDKTSSTRRPYRPGEAIECSQLLIGSLERERLSENKEWLWVAMNNALDCTTRRRRGQNGCHRISR